MSTSDSPCGVPFCRCSGPPLSSPFLRDEAKAVSNIDISASSDSPVVVTPSPTSGGQQPPNDVIDFDYWIHRLLVQTASAETLSNSTALPPPLPVFDKTSSRVSPRFIISYWMCFVFQMYLCFKGGPLTAFH